MLNFSVAGGTSGHLLGAALATILLGPWAAVLVLTCVVSVQALIFQDGGLLALGANIFNMAIVGVTVAYFTYRTVQRLARGKPWGIFGGGFAAGWLSIFIAALGVALQLALSGTSPANLAVPAMGGHSRADRHRRGPDHRGRAGVPVRGAPRPGRARIGRRAGGEAVWLGGLVIAVGLAVLAPLASSHPDGLEWVAAQQGFLSLQRAPSAGIMPDYAAARHLESRRSRRSWPGVLGVLLVLAVVGGRSPAPGRNADRQPRTTA